MATLSFALSDLKPIIDHATAAKSHAVMLGHCFDKAFWKPGTKPGEHGFADAKDVDTSKIEPYIVLVKDHGAYFMSGGLPGLMREDGKGNVIAYAKDCNPDVDPDWWDTVRDKCGGDDFSEPVPLRMVQAALSQKPNAKRLIVTLTKNTLRVRGA